MDRDNQLNWIYKRDGTERCGVNLSRGVGRLAVHIILAMGSNERPMFVAKHNDILISDRRHNSVADAQAEAVMYAAKLPALKDAGQSVVINAQIEQGAQAYRDGGNVYDNPFKTVADRNSWATGWLQAYGAQAAARGINAASATAKANAMLEHDMAIMRAALVSLRRAFDFVTSHGTQDAFSAVAFLNDFKTCADDADLAAKWPAFIEFIAADEARRAEALARVTAEVESEAKRDG